MRLLFILCCAILLSACSIQGMVEKTVPENVRTDHTAHIDSLLARDSARIVEVFNLDIADETIQMKIEEILGQVPEGQEIRRDYVGMNSSSSISTSEGKTRDIEIVTEIQTQDGFMTVTGQYALDAKRECCALSNLVVKKFDESPMRKTWETAAKVGKIIGLFFLTLIALTVFLILRSNKKRARRRAESV